MYDFRMQLDISKLIEEFSLVPSDFIVVHIGASTCQESEYYSKFNFRKIIWVEALPEIYEQGRMNILQFENQLIINALLSSKEGEVFRLYKSSNNGESSSILKPQRHLDIHSNVGFVQESQLILSTTLDRVLLKQDLVSKILLVLDVQGVESSVIDGGLVTVLPRTEFIFSEVSSISLYQDQTLFHALTKKLKSLGFSLVMHDINIHSPYGDALYARNFNSRSLGYNWPTTPIHGLLSRVYHSKLINIFRRGVQKTRILLKK